MGSCTLLVLDCYGNKSKMSEELDGQGEENVTMLYLSITLKCTKQCSTFKIMSLDVTDKQLDVSF